VNALSARLSRLPLSERRGLPGLEPKRADVIVAGAVLVERVLAWSGRSELTVSDRGVRWGLAAELAATA
jgi:exopolyphosphatase/guanosine-5'-triphosphate,3'-diphosphate pyrophosphatase